MSTRFNDKTPFEKLDAVLHTLHKYERNKELIKGELYLSNSLDDKNELQSILDKLIKDKYVIQNGDQYRATFEGEYLMAAGGYKGMEESKITDISYQKKLLTEQRITQRIMVGLTLVLAIGTTVAAIYYGHEIYHIYH
ncbi:MAG TPA: hypothetical protein VK559_08600 [Ferruginibacter sp.]|nr:hypothetical protein [Ferruginibacter sp.]